MNTALLAKKFAELRRHEQSHIAAIDAIETYIHQSDKWQRLRINPYTILQKIPSIDLHTFVAEFLYGVHIGLFDLHWNVHCAHCNMITNEQDELAALEGVSYCKMCAMEFEADFVKRVEVTFSLNKAIEDLHIPPVCEPPQNVPAYYAMEVPQHETVRGQHTLEANVYRYFCPITQSRGILTVEGEPTDEVQELALVQQSGDHFDKETLTARPGPIALTLTNKGHPLSGLYVIQNELPEIDIAQLAPRLSGLHIIHYPEFRELFGNQVLSYRERLKIAAVTTIFTDITGSTQMYDRLGDAVAYNIVRDHFDILFAAIEAHGGRVVKTIGDAVMASFITNEQAVQSVIKFLEGLNQYNQQHSDNEHVYLKIGIHRGASILVNLNGALDYFGSTINKAARIQGLSQCGEITLSEDIYMDDAAINLFREAGMQDFHCQKVNLKGIEGEQTIYKVAAVAHTEIQQRREPSLLASIREMLGIGT